MERSDEAGEDSDAWEDYMSGSRLHPVWTLVLCAATMLAINMGIRQAFGLYLKPISQDLNLDRQVFSFAMAILNLVWGVAAPFAGALSDRLGAVRVILAGVAFYVAGLLLMATAAGGSQLILAGAFVGLGVAGTGFTAVFGVIARAAPPEKRASALGMTTMGSAIGQFVSLPYSHVILDATGWVTTLVIMAATAAAMAPLALAFSRNGSSQPHPTSLSEQGLRSALSEALKYPSFLLLTAGFFVCGFHIAAVAVHLPAFLADKGFDPGLGAIALTVVGGANILGTYAFGRIGDMMSKRLALTYLYLGRGAIFLALLYLPLSETSVIIYAFLLGLLWLGTIPLTSGLVVTFFGPRWLSTLYGIVFFSHQVGSFLGAWMGGWLYDKYHSYDMLWWTSVAVALLAAVLHLPIKEYPAPRLAAAAPAK
jgi:predicted MFS family arabinose efflux permease